MLRFVFAWFLAFLVFTSAWVECAPQHDHASHQPDRMGTVHFLTSCSPEVRDEFDLAVATLHSFGYRKSAQLFAHVLSTDPSCSMAEWGIAMSHYRQLWDPPTKDDLRIGLEAAQEGLSMGPKTQRERDYLGAIHGFYQNAGSESHRIRAKRYETAMESLHSRYPQDSEAAIFYALSLIANAPLNDKTYANQKKATQILEPIILQQPRHPGVAHYIIHADDKPVLAPLALDAAKHYSQIAPDSPHALHMPSHIFTRLGLWDDSIASNVASADSAHKQKLTGDELHALDYLVYAYLQTGRITEARKLTQQLPVVQPGDAARYAGLYATAAIPARYWIERQQWDAAAALPLPPQTAPGDAYDSTQATLYFARALGASRLGDFKAAQAAIQPLLSLRDALARSGDGDADQVNVQLKIVSAWIKWTHGDHDAAVQAMRTAAAMEDATEQSPVSPGSIAPAPEMLGDMLLLAKQPKLALTAYESALKSTPGRLRAEYGAAVSAQQAGLRATAERHFRILLTNCSHADSDLPELTQANYFLAKTSTLSIRFPRNYPRQRGLSPYTPLDAFTTQQAEDLTRDRVIPIRNKRQITYPPSTSFFVKTVAVSGHFGNHTPEG
jgi:tetratricopeptide (TPR) repeat protein